MSRCSILVAAWSVACGLVAYAAPPIADPNPARFETDIRAFEAWDRQNSFPKDAVLFVGSSSIRMWPTAESFPDLPAINRGFGGSHTSDVNHFAERIVIKYRPRLVVFYCGDNDVADGKSAEQVADDFREFVAIVRRELPDSEIIYLPIKPSIARWDKWPRMQAANGLVREFIGGQPQTAYIDTATPMLSDDGRPRRELFVDDGLHLNAAGYRLWNEILRPRLGARPSN